MAAPQAGLQPAPPALPVDGPAPDAAMARAPGVRGEACRATACANDLQCVTALPGGYCASRCGVGNAACDGTCVDTRDGELCARSCTSDRDCRFNEGYVCDPQWHACLVPNFAAIVPKLCPTQSGRDVAFGEAEQLAIKADSHAGVDAVVLDDGSLVARSDARLARDRRQTLYVIANGELARSTDRGASWSRAGAAFDPSDCADGACTMPLIAIGKAVHVLYAAGDNGLRVRTSRDGGDTFATGPIILTGTRGNAVATADGKLHVVAMTGSALGAYGSAMQRIEYTVSADGGATFTAPVTVSGREEVLPYLFSNPSIAVDVARRFVYVAYARGGRDGAWDIALAMSKDAGATWTRTKLAGDGCAIHMVPNLALDANTGTLHVAYYDSEGAAGRFVHASCAAGAKRCKVHGAINGVPFATLSLARASSKSVGEYQRLAFDDKRRILHAVWAQPVDEAGQPVTRVFHATAKLRR